MSITNAQKVNALTVSELTMLIQAVLEPRFDSIDVVGEISNARQHSSGHWYFSLKDKDAILPCVCWRSSAQTIPFEIEDGLQVVAKGKLSVWPPRGGYQMVVTKLSSVGVGDWQVAFEQLRKKLDAEGLLAPERKRSIPALPRRIGVVTSPSAAALRDILSALKRRNPNVQVLISPCRVQGEGSVEEIVLAINDLQNLEDIDVIIVARGGGSIEDLWSFNSEAVARAVAASRIPVISGVGHETDTTICDLVADLRATTPTAAAELVAKGRVELIQNWSALSRRLFHSIQHRVSRARLAFQRLDPRYALSRHGERVKNMRVTLESRKVAALRAIERKVSDSRYRLQKGHEKLLALSAMNVLKRGFSILQKLDGTVIRSAGEAAVGEILIGRLYDGKLKLKVEGVEE